MLQRACLDALEPRMLLSATAYFQPAVSYTTGYQPCAVAVGDFNHDGKADMVTVNASSTQDPGSMSLLLGKGDGTFEDAVSIPTDIDPSAVVVGRFNNDAYDDIAVTCYDSGSGGSASVVDIFLGNSSGSFQTMTSFATPDSPVSLALADFNGDHHPDLAVSSHKGAGDLNLSVYLGDGAGGFALQSSYVSYWNWALTSGDFNEDGTVDLAVTSLASSQDNYSVTIYTGNGDGTFAAHATGCTIDDGPTAITATDLNGDGHLDLAVTSQNVQTTGLGILQGAGDGTFAGPANFSALGLADGLAAADFDNDGHMDLAIAQGGDDSLRLKLGNGAGAFRDIGDEEISVGGGPQGVAIADFNGDRLNDVAVTDQSGTSVSVVLGAGPILSDLAFMLNRNATYTFNKKLFTPTVYSDTNHLALAGVKIISLPANGTLKLKGKAVTAGQVIPTAQLGSLSYVINKGYGGLDGFTWRAYDGVSYSGLASVQFITTPEATITGASPAREGNPATSSSFTIQLNHASLVNVGVGLSMAGHAVGGKNYVKPPKTLTIPAGATSALYTLTPLVDGLAKGDLDVIAKLSGGKGYTVGAVKSATDMIVDDEPKLSIAATVGNTHFQAADAGEFTLSLSAPAAQDLVLTLVIGGSAKNGGDYQLLAKTVTIPAGSTSSKFEIIPSLNPTKNKTITLSCKVIKTGFSLNPLAKSALVNILHVV